MFSISEVAKITGVTARALRHYEEKGLICSVRNGGNGYRYYPKSILNKIEKIKEFKEMKLSLDEISSLMKLSDSSLSNSLSLKLKEKLSSIEKELYSLAQTKADIEKQLLATTDFFDGKNLSRDQRRFLMDAIKREVLEQLKMKKEVGTKELSYLERESYLFDTQEKREFFAAVKDCLAFAKKEGIRLGPVRGSSPALLSLYALGWSEFDPSEHDLIPERFAATEFDLHIDVEFKNGKKFIDYCKGVSSSLRVGKIEAFRLPILDIIENTHRSLGKAIDYDSIDDNDNTILDIFRSGDIEKVFSFDIPADTLLAKHCDDNYYKRGVATEMLSHYLKSQKLYSFKDLLNIEAIFRPNNLDTKPFMREYIDRYPKAKEEGFYYDDLSPFLNESFKDNFGVIIYQEDIIRIIREYTSWDYEKCNIFRRALSFGTISEEQKVELKEYTGGAILDLLIKESPVVFCKAHSVGAWPKLIKATAYLKAKHKDIYYAEIEKWEKENSYSWGDFGFISGAISILQ